jgi:hypothetical protein
VTCHVYLRVGGIIFASFYDFAIGLWIYSESVAFFSILSDNFFLAVPYSMHVDHLTECIAMLDVEHVLLNIMT